MTDYKLHQAVAEIADAVEIQDAVIWWKGGF